MSDVLEPTSVPPGHTSPFSVPVFREIWFASMASNFGGLIQSVGASWMMIALGANSQMVALVSTATFLPIMLLALVAGAIADNFDKRLIMLAAHGFMLSVSAVLAVLGWLGLLTPWLLLTFTFLIGCGVAFNIPAWQASIGEMVPRPLLAVAVAYNSMGFNIARSVGPALGGVIVAGAGAAMAFTINAISYIGPMTAIWRWRPSHGARLLPPERIDIAMRTGVRYVLSSPDILSILVRAGLFGMAGSPVTALMPLVARDLIRGSAFTYGLLLGAFGMGAVVGALAIGRLRGRWSSERIVLLASAAMAAGAAICSFSGFLGTTMFAMSLNGAGWVVGLSTFNSSIQLASPRWVGARTLAFYQMSAFGGMAAGSWIFGWLTDHHGVSSALLIASAGLAASALSGLVLPMPRLENINLDLRGTWTEPPTAVPIGFRDGPVAIDIEYRIAPKDAAAFLSAMSERRRIRSRDGASGWSLTRDLADEELWVEHYKVSTWLDYVRHNQRRTHADGANSDLIARLQRSGPPRVRRHLEQHIGAPADGAAAGGLDDPLTDPTRAT